MKLICRRCNQLKALTAFPKVTKRKYGHDTICKQCKNADNRIYMAWYRDTPNGKANQTWHKLLDRCCNKNGKNPAYARVECRMSQEEFMQWYIQKYSNWMASHPDETASVDRIDSAGHYEISNIRLISLSENVRRSRTPKTAEQIAENLLRLCQINEVSLQSVLNLLSKQKSQPQELPGTG